MKQGKRPTRKQKELIGEQRIGNQYLNPEKWLVRQLSGNDVLLIHRVSGKTRKVEIG
ncbi:DUF6906 family protein [Enterococcus ureilyticus]|uniref:DUF6906 family protein n=1 Tax=Enterococcus ureilyticus TaxID=1131292 RepID=UPI001428CB47|nr:hypothetical protein [Enterococcus ureilyticus]MBM7688416.1 hypothetical protein [Enterococcus ureilyticus]